MTKIAERTYAAGFLLLMFSLAWSSPQALAQSSPTRYEQTNPSVTYTSGWTEDTSRSWSGGTAAASTTPGAQATFTFTGPSVNWIGGRGPWAGIARVSLDGVLVSQVDTYSRTEEIRVPMFTANGLTNASHTLTIENTGQTNPLSTSTYVVVDAFDVPGPAVARLQETDPDVTYTAGWVQDNTLNSLAAGITNYGTPNVSLRNWSAAAATLSTMPGGQATFTFTGTSISWIGARGPQSGIADVFLDGSLVAEVDLYSATEQIQQAVFTATGLADASHTNPTRWARKRPSPSLERGSAGSVPADRRPGSLGYSWTEPSSRTSIRMRLRRGPNIPISQRRA